MPYPTTVLSLAQAIGSQFLNLFHGGSVSHSDGTNAMLDDLIAVEEKLGTGASTPIANTVLRGTGTGTTAFGQIVGGDVATGSALSVASVTTSATVVAGTGLYAGGQSTYGQTVQTTGSLANGASLTFGTGFAWLYSINNSTGAMCSVMCQGALNTVLAHSASTTGFTINSDSGSDIAIFWNGSAYAVKNRSGGALAVTVLKFGS